MKCMRAISTVHAIPVLCAIAAFGLAACGKPAPPPKVEDTVFGDLVSTKQKAKDETEKAMEANKKKLEEAMKKSEGGDAQ